MLMQFKIKKVSCILMGILFSSAIVLIYKKYGFGIVFLAYAGMVAVLMTTAVIDIKKQIIPNKLILICFLLSIVSLLFSDDMTILSGILGCVLCGGLLLILSFVTKDGIGLGDAKLFAAIGLGLGAARAVNVLMISAVLSGLFGLVLMIINVHNRKRTIPFAPFILLAVLIVLNS